MSEATKNLRRIEGRRVVKKLKEAGIEVDSIFDLVNASDPYPSAIPVLLGVLPTVNESWIKQGVIRALTVKDARGVAAKSIIDEFKRPDASEGVRWACGNALSVVATEDNYGEIVALIEDRTLGSGRQMLALALGRMKTPEATKVLINCLSDEEILPHVIEALGKRKDETALSSIAPFRDHPRKLVRRETEKALKKLQKPSKK